MGISSLTVIRRGRPAEHTVTTPERPRPSRGRAGPLEVGEQFPRDTLTRCRRTLLCRHAWKVPHGLGTVTCPAATPGGPPHTSAARESPDSHA